MSEAVGVAGGVIGCSVACRAARRGAGVATFEASRICCDPGGVGDGMFAARVPGARDAVITLPRRLLDEIVARARRAAPEEVCGWLAGRSGKVRATYPVPNAAEDPGVRFSMDPEAQLRAMREIERSGAEILGTYHSHPRTPPVPSRRDRDLAFYPDAAHLIVSLASPEPRLRCYRITPEETVELGLLVRPW